MMNRKIKFSLIIASCLLLIGFLFFSLVKGGIVWIVAPDANRYPIRGIDASHHQAEIDWQKVARDNITFAYIKATEADDFQDNLFATNWKAAQDAGIVTGAYHFYSLAFTGEIQAENFTNTVPTEANHLPPVVDLEYKGNSRVRPPKQDFQKNLSEFINRLESNYGKRPILYVTYEFYDDYLYPEFKNERIWIRDIFSKPDEKRIGEWIFWQYSPFGKVEGIKKSVDLNVFSGSELEFEKLIKS